MQLHTHTHAHTHTILCLGFPTLSIAVHIWTHQCSIQIPAHSRSCSSQPLSQPCRGRYICSRLHSHSPDHWLHPPERTNPEVSYPLRTVVLNQGWVFSQETFLLIVTHWEGEGMQLNILQCIGQSPTTKNYTAQNVNSAKTGKPCLWRSRGQLSCPQQLANKPAGAASSGTTGHGLYNKIPTLDTVTWTRVGRHLSQWQPWPTGQFPLSPTCEKAVPTGTTAIFRTRPFLSNVNWRLEWTAGQLVVRKRWKLLRESSNTGQIDQPHLSSLIKLNTPARSSWQAEATRELPTRGLPWPLELQTGMRK